MGYFFSKTTRGWYHTEAHEVMPDDVVEVSDELRAVLQAGHYATGKQIIGDENGNPILVPRVEAGTLEEGQSFLLDLIGLKCQEALSSGFSSDALGADHLYMTNPLDLQNLQMALIVASTPALEPTWTTMLHCMSVDQEWSDVAHNAAQVIQVGKARQASRDAIVTKKNALVKQIRDAKSTDDLVDINW